MGKERVIVITGGASGIGKETAYTMAEEGDVIVVSDKDEQLGKQVADEINSRGGKAAFYKTDVSKRGEVEALIDFTVKEFGTITGMFNNAGIGLVKPFLEMDPPSYQKVIEVDQDSVYYGMYYAARKMVDLGVENGVIVNTASIYGSMAAVGSFNYNAAKAAVIAMSRSGALELAPHNIRVVGIAPGFIDTPILQLDEATKNYLASQHMRKKLIQPEKVASVVKFLFSEDADAINGTTIAIDDGFLSYK